MSDPAKYYGYCLVGFGSYLDWKTIEFLERLPDAHVCNYCGAAPTDVVVFPCMHILCRRCGSCVNIDKRYSYTCPVDRMLCQGSALTVMAFAKEALLQRMVRCPHASDGCDFTGKLAELGSHFPRGCDFARTVCSCCGARISFKELYGHYTACRTSSDSLLETSAKSKRLLEDLANTKKELEREAARGSSDGDPPQVTVDSVLEVLERLRVQLADGVSLIP